MCIRGSGRATGPQQVARPALVRAGATRGHRRGSGPAPPRKRHSAGLDRHTPRAREDSRVAWVPVLEGGAIPVWAQHGTKTHWAEASGVPDLSGCLASSSYALAGTARREDIIGRGRKRRPYDGWLAVLRSGVTPPMSLAACGRRAFAARHDSGGSTPGPSRSPS